MATRSPPHGGNDEDEGNRVGVEGGAETEDEGEDGQEFEVGGEWEEGAEEEGREEEEGDGSEEEEEEEDRVVRRKIIIVVSFGGKGEEAGRRRSSPPRYEAEVGCQVDGCNVDLGEAKRYHRRHKVCERHAKAAVARVGGVDQRFCQQCSRFHEVALFDGAKRSCRNRLAGHNERRRKVPSALKADVSKQQVAVP